MKPIIVYPPSGNLSIIEQSYIYLGVIKPNRVIKDKNVYRITYLDPVFILKGFVVITENNLVQSVLVFGYHPNRDPDTKLYCLPDRKKNMKYSEDFVEMLITNLKTYYLDECFFTPSLSQIKYKKMKSMFVKLNQGE